MMMIRIAVFEFIEEHTAGSSRPLAYIGMAKDLSTYIVGNQPENPNPTKRPKIPSLPGPTAVNPAPQTGAAKDGWADAKRDSQKKQELQNLQNP